MYAPNRATALEVSGCPTVLWSPYDHRLAQHGTKMIRLRMKAHGIDGLQVMQALECSPLLTQAIHPGQAIHPRNVLAYRQLAPHARVFVDVIQVEREDGDEGGFPYGGMMTFRICSRAVEVNAFLTSTWLFKLAESLCGEDNLGELPAQIMHAGIPKVERTALGIGKNLIRLSVGMEVTVTLVQDMERQTLKVAVQRR